MLKTLTVTNFALIAHAHLIFGAGLNVLTGETGAGKSILIGALGAALGQRLSRRAMRTGADFLRVEAVFDAAQNTPIAAFLSAQEIKAQGTEIHIVRQISKSGRGAAFINGQHVTLTVLHALGELLVNVHGQNENLRLLRADSPLQLLNASAAVSSALQNYQETYAAWKQWTEALQKIQQDAQNAREREDLLRWQEKEIADAALQSQEDVQLEKKIRYGTYIEKIAGWLEDAHELLDGEAQGERLPVLSALHRVRQDITSLLKYDASLENAKKLVEDSLYQLQEAVYEIRDHREDMEANPLELETMQRRMDVIDKLRRKYGASVTEILQRQKDMQAELEAMEHYEDNMQTLREKIVQAEKVLAQRADVLTKARREAAKNLSARILQNVVALGMERAHLYIQLEPTPTYEASGKDRARILFSANVGEAAQELAKVASGGELSRISLAIQAAHADGEDAIPSLVFDEVDTGIGGQTAQKVAEQIAKVAQQRQVLCVTHLAQIACMADRHFYIHKATAENRVATEVQVLNAKTRLHEIARMASGNAVTAAALDNAQEMVDNAKIKKESLGK